jgi:glycosyltransferase involved in cell wall biosynthesis
LSKKVRESLIATANLPPDKLLKIDWGPDLAFYDTAYRCHRSPKAARRPLIVSAGKADRDHDTLVRATTLIDCTVKIFCSENSKPAGQIDESRVIITSGPGNHNAISYGDLLGEYEAANVIGIPLTHVEELAGLTSLLDAMAMAKPVIMTRNPYIDIDIEKQGIGIWVDVGDVEGWATAISELISKPALAREMGLRGRALCEKQYNLERFTDELASAIAEAVS